MLTYVNQPTSSGRVQSWLDSMYHHHSNSNHKLNDLSEKSEKLSLVSNSSKSSINRISTRSTMKSSLRKSISTSSSSSFTNRNVRRRIYLRRPRLLIKRFKDCKKSNKQTNFHNNNRNVHDLEQSSYLSNYSSADESNLFSTVSGPNLLLNDDSPRLPEIKADDLEFEHHTGLISSSGSSNCTTNHYSGNNHSFGVLDFENFDSLHLNDELVFKVKTYAFSAEEIKIKLKDSTLTVIGKQQTEEENGWFKREFRKHYALPPNVDKKAIKYDFDKDDHLIITVPRLSHSVH